jgi:hypothetical protein
MPRLPKVTPCAFLLGVDLGKVQDPTAIAIAEMCSPDIHIRHLERVRLGTPYPKVIERITGLVAKLPDASLVVDATGVGRPVIDQMRETGLEPIPVTITGGRDMTFDGDMWRVPKKALLRPLVAASEAGRLKVAKGLRKAEAFQRELQAFQRRITARGYSAFGGVGEHDDLVIAVALICWRVEISRRVGACNAA